jgi:hypothetical protein
MMFVLHNQEEHMLRYVLASLLLGLTACSSTPRPPTFMPIGISARAADLCNSLIDEELKDFAGDFTTEEIACTKAIAFRLCGNKMLDDLRAMDAAGEAEAALGRPVAWGTEWCTEDFNRKAEMDERHHCGASLDPAVVGAATEILESIVARAHAHLAGPLN